MSAQQSWRRPTSFQPSSVQSWPSLVDPLERGQSATKAGVTRIICSALLVLAAMAAHGGATDKPDPEEWLREAEAAYDRVTGYTAVFHKQQRVAGKLLPGETILLSTGSHSACT